MSPRDQRFPRSARLTRGSQFRAVLTKGRRVHGTHLVVHLLLHDGPTSRLGLTVSRKVGGAVVRNRLKRRLREIFRRDLRPALDEGGATADVVIRARPEAAGADFTTLRREVMASATARRRRGGSEGRP